MELLRMVMEWFGLAPHVRPLLLRITSPAPTYGFTSKRGGNNMLETLVVVHSSQLAAFCALYSLCAIMYMLNAGGLHL